VRRHEHIRKLRTFHIAADTDPTSTTHEVAYKLVEIPIELLLRLANLEPDNFSAWVVNDSVHAQIQATGGLPAFNLNLDVSVEKAPTLSLLAGLCITHGHRVVPIAA